MMKKWMMGCLVVLMVFIASAEVTVSNLVVAQRPGTKLVDISYDVSNTDAVVDVLMVTLSVSNGTSAVSCPSVTGDVRSVALGTGRSMVWNAGEDWNGESAAGLSFSVTADDGLVEGGDPTAVAWVEINDRWVKNIYANGDITMSDRTKQNVDLQCEPVWF